MHIFYEMLQEQVFSRGLFQWLLLEQRPEESTVSHSLTHHQGITESHTEWFSICMTDFPTPSKNTWKHIQIRKHIQIHKHRADLIPAPLLNQSSPYSRSVAGMDLSALQPGDPASSHLTAGNTSFCTSVLEIHGHNVCSGIQNQKCYFQKQYLQRQNQKHQKPWPLQTLQNICALTSTPHPTFSCYLHHSKASNPAKASFSSLQQRNAGKAQSSRWMDWHNQK